jgi:hypothetical protein
MILKALFWKVLQSGGVALKSDFTRFGARFGCCRHMYVSASRRSPLVAKEASLWKPRKPASGPDCLGKLASVAKEASS